MLKNGKYNLGRKYNFYAPFPLDQTSKEATAVAIKKRNSTEETRHKNNPPGSIS